MVREGVNFTVCDAKSGDDITRTVLTQIIFEEENKGTTLLPIQFSPSAHPLLRRQHAGGGAKLSGVLARLLMREQDELRQNMLELFGAEPFKVLEEQTRRNVTMSRRPCRPSIPSPSRVKPCASARAPTSRSPRPRPPSRNRRARAISIPCSPASGHAGPAGRTGRQEEVRLSLPLLLRRILKGLVQARQGRTQRRNRARRHLRLHRGRQPAPDERPPPRRHLWSRRSPPPHRLPVDRRPPRWCGGGLSLGLEVRSSSRADAVMGVRLCRSSVSPAASAAGSSATASTSSRSLGAPSRL